MKNEYARKLSTWGQVVFADTDHIQEITGLHQLMHRTVLLFTLKQQRPQNHSNSGYCYGKYKAFCRKPSRLPSLRTTPSFSIPRAPSKENNKINKLKSQFLKMTKLEKQMMFRAVIIIVYNNYIQDQRYNHMYRCKFSLMGKNIMNSSNRYPHTCGGHESMVYVGLFGRSNLLASGINPY